MRDATFAFSGGGSCQTARSSVGSLLPTGRPLAIALQAVQGYPVQLLHLLSPPSPLNKHPVAVAPWRVHAPTWPGRLPHASSLLDEIMCPDVVCLHISTPAY